MQKSTQVNTKIPKETRAALQESAYDIAIIGAGPVGLFAAFQASMLGLRAVLIDALPEPGGQCRALYPDKPIYDIPALPKVSGGELVDNLLEQIRPFDVPILTGITINRCEYSAAAGRWHLGGAVAGTVATVDSFTLAVKVVIIAAGGGAFGPNRPPLPDLEQLEGRSLFYAVQNPELFRGKRVVIAGGGDSAVDWAIVLSEIATRVTLVHRRPKFRALPHSLQRLQELSQMEAARLEIMTPWQVDSVQAAAGQITAVNLRHLAGETTAVDADFLLFFFGLAMDNSPLQQLGLFEWTADRKHLLVEPATMLAHRDGIFAVGDICHYPGKLKLILTGFAEAALACHSAYSLVHPDSPLHFEYSTSKGLPGGAAT